MHFVILIYTVKTIKVVLFVFIMILPTRSMVTYLSFSFDFLCVNKAKKSAEHIITAAKL